MHHCLASQIQIFTGVDKENRDHKPLTPGPDYDPGWRLNRLVIICVFTCISSQMIKTIPKMIDCEEKAFIIFLKEARLSLGKLYKLSNDKIKHFTTFCHLEGTTQIRW